MSAAAMAAAGAAPRPRAGWLARKAGGAARLLVAALLMLTPVTAILALGWFMRLMRAETDARRAALAESAQAAPARWPNWLMAEAPETRGLARFAGALAANARAGLAGAATLLLGTAPFTLLWLFSWWAGWQNSFAKGYEHAWVGPSIGLVGVALALVLIARLPMALAHQAATGRMGAFFEFGAVRRLMRAAGWRYAALGLAAALAALPLFALKGSVVFVEQWSPGFADRNPEAVEAFARSHRFWSAVYLVLALLVLRRWAARLYARAAHRLETRPEPPRWRAWVGAALQSLVLWPAAFAIVAQIYVGQFLNHQWSAWIVHPLLTLPWIPR